MHPSMQLFDALKTNDSVTSVNLSNCSISDEGVQVGVTWPCA